MSQTGNKKAKKNMAYGEGINGQMGKVVQISGLKKRQCTEVFQGSEITLNNTLKVDRCHYTFVQTPRMSNIKSNGNVNSGLWC